MPAREIVPSPLARTLLDLAARRADGRIAVGRREVTLAEGQVIDVGRAVPEDESIDGFLVRGGFLRMTDIATFRAKAEKGKLGEIEALDMLDIDESQRGRARRALWLDRLARGLAPDEALGAFVPEPKPAGRVPSVPLVPLLLDALTRRAADEEAGIVGSRAGEHVSWLTAPGVEEARTWCASWLAGDGRRVGDVLTKVPSAAAQIAALIRAGFVRLEGPKGSLAPPPPTRRATLAPIGMLTPRNIARPQPSLPPPREPARVLDPGAAAAGLPELPEPLALPALAEYVGPLDDPLEALERAIAKLEEAGAPGPERAEAWHRLASAWSERYGAIEEEARAEREAAAADPTAERFLRAAELCEQVGDLAATEAYARAAAAGTTNIDLVTLAQSVLLRASRRSGRLDAMIEALRAQIEHDPEAYGPRVALARAHASRGAFADAAHVAAETAERLAKVGPTHAIAWLDHALILTRCHPLVTGMLARRLADEGRPGLAIALVRRAANASQDTDARRIGRLAAVELAEMRGDLEHASEILLRAFDEEPHVDVLYEPLAAYVEATAAPAERAVLLEAIARSSSWERRAEWALRAAQAHAAHPGGVEWARELAVRALLEDPTSTEAVELLRQHGETTGDYAGLADAFERIARNGRGGDPPAILRELVDLAEKRLGAPQRALWAAHRLDRVEPTAESRDAIARIEPKVRVKDGMIDVAQKELEAAAGDGRLPAARRLAALLRDAPEERARAIETYRFVLESDPTDQAAASALERLLAIVGDDPGWLGLLVATLDRTESRGERLRILGTALPLAAWLGRHDEVVSLARRFLELAPDSLDAVVRWRRAAASLGDDASLTAAIEHELPLVAAGGKRALLVMLARARARRADPAGALDAALRALDLAPDAADAALVAAEALSALDDGESTTRALERIAPTLAGTTAWLDVAIARAARRGDLRATYEAAVARRALTPWDDACEAVTVRAAIALGDPSLLAEETSSLASRSLDEASLDALEQSVRKLAAAGRVHRAIDLVFQALGASGERSLLAAAIDLAAQSGDPRHAVLARERMVALAPEGKRAKALHALAELHASRKDRAGETRALLRVLADTPRDLRALDRLEAIFAATNEPDRLMAVLALRLEASTTLEERAEALLRLAGASMALAADVDRAIRFIRQISDGAPEEATAAMLAAGVFRGLDRNALAEELLVERIATVRPAETEIVALAAASMAFHLRGDRAVALERVLAGLARAPRSTALLLAFENLALAENAVESARTTYEALCENAIGRHGRRGLRYRQARWLERAGERAGAFDAYRQAFELGPGEGTVFRALERLAEPLGRVAPLVDAVMHLAEKSPHVDRYLELIDRAATLCQGPLGDPNRAFDIVDAAWRKTGRSALLPSLRRIARMLKGDDGNEARRRIVESLEARVEMDWDADDQVKTLALIASVQALDAGDLAAAGATLERLSKVASGGDADGTIAADTFAEAAVWHRTAGDDAGAARWARRALELVADHPRALPIAAASAERVAAAPEPASPAGGAEAPAPPGPRKSNTLRTMHLSSVPPPPDPKEEERWTPAPAPAEVSGPVADVLREPFDAQRWRDLAEGPDPRLRAVARAWLSILAGEDAEEIELGQVVVPPHPSDIEAGLEVLARVWVAAMPLFRRALRDYDVVGTHRITELARRPLGRALAAVGGEAEAEDLVLYVRPDAPVELSVVATQPPSVLVAPSIEDHEAFLPFRIARALALSTPSHVLLASRSLEEARVVVDAIRGAFGSPDAHRQIDPDAAALAADLWHTISPREQVALRDHVVGAGRAFKIQALRDAVFARAALVALAATKRWTSAILALRLDDPTIDRVEPSLLGDATRTSSALRALIGAALRQPA